MKRFVANIYIFLHLWISINAQLVNSNNSYLNTLLRAQNIRAAKTATEKNLHEDFGFVSLLNNFDTQRLILCDIKFVKANFSIT